MRRRYASFLATHVDCGIASLALVFGLVVQPLLVVCIREDGRVLIEVAGHDTCHEESGQEHMASGAASGPTPGVAAGDWHDPCLDLSLYRPADAQDGVNPAPHASDGAALQADVAALCTLPEGHGAVHKPPPRMLPPPSGPALLFLRI